MSTPADRRLAGKITFSMIGKAAPPPPPPAAPRAKPVASADKTQPAAVPVAPPPPPETEEDRRRAARDAALTRARTAFPDWLAQTQQSCHQPPNRCRSRFRADSGMERAELLTKGV